MIDALHNGPIHNPEDAGEQLCQDIQNIKLNLIRELYEIYGENYGNHEAVVGYRNYLYGQSLGFSMGGDGTWLSCVQQMGAWYKDHIHTYQTGTDNHAHGAKGWFSCPLLNGEKVADDCSGYVQACLRLFGVNCPSITTSVMQSANFMKIMADAGFNHFFGQFDKTNLQPGDIICGRASTHTEIYAGDGHSWSWGSIHDGLNGHKGMPAPFCSIARKGGYVHCWRI